MCSHVLSTRTFLLAVCASALLPRPMQAQVSGTTILTFNIPGGYTVPQDYGDNVAGPTQGNYTYVGTGTFTPAIDVTYATMPQNVPLSLWGLGYGDLLTVAYGPGNATALTLTFTAIPGQLAILFGFDIAGFGGFSTTLTSITVRNGLGAVLGSLANVAIPSDPYGHVDIDFNPPLAAQIIQLEIVVPLGSWYNLGLSNVAFGQSGSGQATGQANSVAAALRVNSFGPAGLAGPFQLLVPSSGTLTLDWQGPAGMPLLLATGNVNPAVLNLGCFGLLDIGTPPAFADFAIVFNGTVKSFPNLFFHLGSQGTASQSFTLAGLSGLTTSIQGAVVQPAGSGCSLKLTAAFTLSFS